MAAESASYPKTKLRTVLICGRAVTGTAAERVLTGEFEKFGLELIGVLYRSTPSKCYRHARNQGMATIRNIRDLRTLGDIDVIIDLSGEEAKVREILGEMPRVCLLDPLTVRILLHTVKTEEKRIGELTTMVETFRQEAENYWGLFDNAVAGLYRTRISDGSMIMCNSKLAHILGFKSREDVIRKYNVAKNYVDPTRRFELLEKLRKQGAVQNFEIRQRRRDGSIFWAELSARFFPEKDYLEGMLQDVTVRKEVEEKNILLTRQLISVREEGQKRIARDLHDELGQSLTALQFSMNALENSLPEKSLSQREKCGHIIYDISRIGNIVRNIAYELRPDILDTLGLIPALEWHVRSAGTRLDSLRIRFRHPADLKRFAPEIEIVLYRVFQEALNNVIRHARATLARINLKLKGEEILLTVADNGVGFESDEGAWMARRHEGGIGLLGMRERVLGMGGSMDVRSSPGKGTEIEIRLPAMESYG